MTGCATDVGLILGRALGRLLRKDGCGFTQPEKNRLGLYGRLSLGFVDPRVDKTPLEARVNSAGKL